MKSIANHRNRSVKLAAAATVGLAAIGATAGCAGQSASTSGAAAPSTVRTSALQATVATTPATSTPAATAGASATTTRQGVAVAVEDCGQGAALTRPAALVLACADQGLWAKKLIWSSWSATGATATGIITWHVCTPNCADSTQWDSTSAQVTLTDPKSEPGNKVLFTQLELRVTGPTPAGFTRVATFDMAPN